MGWGELRLGRVVLGEFVRGGVAKGWVAKLGAGWSKAVWGCGRGERGGGVAVFPSYGWWVGWDPATGPACAQCGSSTTFGHSSVRGLPSTRNTLANWSCWKSLPLTCACRARRARVSDEVMDTDE